MKRIITIAIVILVIGAVAFLAAIADRGGTVKFCSYSMELPENMKYCSDPNNCELVAGEPKSIFFFPLYPWGVGMLKSVLVEARLVGKSSTDEQEIDEFTNTFDNPQKTSSEQITVNGMKFLKVSLLGNGARQAGMLLIGSPEDSPLEGSRLIVGLGPIESTQLAKLEAIQNSIKKQ